MRGEQDDAGGQHPHIAPSTWRTRQPNAGTPEHGGEDDRAGGAGLHEVRREFGAEENGEHDPPTCAAKPS